MITKQQWIAFGLCVEEGKNKKITADIMGLTYNEVKILLEDLKEQEPALFPVESEKANVRQYLSSKEREKYNTDVVSYEARKDKGDMVEDEIRHKY